MNVKLSKAFCFGGCWRATRNLKYQKRGLATIECDTVEFCRLLSDVR